MRTLLTGIILCLLTGCHPQEKRDSSILYIDHQNLKEISSFNPLSLIDSCSYIPLETSANVLIGSIHELKVTEQHIFVSDYSSNTLFIFNRQGKFLNKIGKQGRGPEEYQYLRSFTVTPAHDTVILYDDALFRLQFYTPDNQYIRTVELYKHLHRDSNVFRHVNGIYSLGNGKLLLNYTYMHLHPVAYSLYDYQCDSLYDIGFMPFQMTMPGPNATFTIEDPIVSQYQGNTSCCISFNDTIFQIQHNSLRPRIIVPALKDRMVDDELIRLQNGKAGEKAIRLLAGKGLFITHIHENDTYFFITYCDQGRSKEIIWNKALNKGILVSSDNYYGYNYSPGKLNISDLSDEEQDSPFYHTPQLEKLKPFLKEDDNPVIVLYHLKPDGF